MELHTPNNFNLWKNRERKSFRFIIYNEKKEKKKQKKKCFEALNVYSSVFFLFKGFDSTSHLDRQFTVAGAITINHS